MTEQLSTTHLCVSYISPLYVILYKYFPKFFFFSTFLMRLYYNFKKLYSQVSIFSVIASGFGVKEKNVLFLGYKGINSYVHFSCC